MSKTIEVTFNIGKAIREFTHGAGKAYIRSGLNLIHGDHSSRGIRPETVLALSGELTRARGKFPAGPDQSRKVMDALVEEVGELAKARLEWGPESEQAKMEALHVAAVAIRILEEGMS